MLLKLHDVDGRLVYLVASSIVMVDAADDAEKYKLGTVVTAEGQRIVVKESQQDIVYALERLYGRPAESV